MPLPIRSFPPCRTHDLYWPLEDHAVAIKRNPAAEIYWLSWDHSFGDRAAIRIARLAGHVVATRRFQPSFRKARVLSTCLRCTDWERLEDAVVAANFWTLGKEDLFNHFSVIDGATWTIAGHRHRQYHVVKRRSPDDALYDLGRLMFDLVGLTDVSL